MVGGVDVATRGPSIPWCGDAADARPVRASVRRPARHQAQGAPAELCAAAARGAKLGRAEPEPILPLPDTNHVPAAVPAALVVAGQARPLPHVVPVRGHLAARRARDGAGPEPRGPVALRPALGVHDHSIADEWQLHELEPQPEPQHGRVPRPRRGEQRQGAVLLERAGAQRLRARRRRRGHERDGRPRVPARAQRGRGQPARATVRTTGIRVC
jgi:hypothetical protein